MDRRRVSGRSGSGKVGRSSPREQDWDRGRSRSGKTGAERGVRPGSRFEIGRYRDRGRQGDQCPGSGIGKEGDRDRGKWINAGSVGSGIGVDIEMSKKWDCGRGRSRLERPERKEREIGIREGGRIEAGLEGSRIEADIEMSKKRDWDRGRSRLGKAGGERGPRPGTRIAIEGGRDRETREQKEVGNQGSG
ncbi:hypothetical protein CBR_g46828 [Chara braunii]|uniref:Uncharacterized protein n=1 Tax=Chara braunii TaxID=69332 RepID=A0A388M199_CHABU|nr:hypothetical protein CBR_g46828 [Chara braunii]|eukprot:GBG88262.1 hypothetical protein CBR_g46828 [Chara braunii]